MPAGADACNEESRLATWVVNMTHIIGLFTYALVLGIVSDDVQRLVEGFKTGNNPICEAGHTVVLNSNPTTPSLLRQVPHCAAPLRACMSTAHHCALYCFVLTDLKQCQGKRRTGHGFAEHIVSMLEMPVRVGGLCTGLHAAVQWAKAQGERGTHGTIVLLADQPKEDLDEVVDTLKAETGLDIVARSGLPYSLDDLDLVGASDASTIIIMDPNHHVHEQARRASCLLARQCRVLLARGPAACTRLRCMAWARSGCIDGFASCSHIEATAACR